MTDLPMPGASELAALIRTRAVSRGEVMAAYLDRIDRDDLRRQSGAMDAAPYSAGCTGFPMR